MIELSSQVFVLKDCFQLVPSGVQSAACATNPRRLSFLASCPQRIAQRMQPPTARVILSKRSVKCALEPPVLLRLPGIRVCCFVGTQDSLEFAHHRRGCGRCRNPLFAGSKCNLFAVEPRRIHQHLLKPPDHPRRASNRREPKRPVRSETHNVALPGPDRFTPACKP